MYEELIKMSEFYMPIALEIFISDFLFFGGGRHVLTCPLSPTPMAQGRSQKFVFGVQKFLGV